MTAEDGESRREPAPGPPRIGSDTPPAGLDEHLAHPDRPWRTALSGGLLTLLAVAGVITAFVGAGPSRVDAAVLGESIEARSATLTALATTLTTVGNTAAMGLLASLVGLWLISRRRAVEALYVVGTMAGAAALFTGVKRLLDRPRPPAVDQLVAASNESLPSGHATMAVAVLGSLVVLAWPGRGRLARAAMVVGVAGWAGAVGLTRIYLGVHWFSDVLAGWLVGAAWLALCTALWSWYRSRATPRRAGSLAW
jgi:membrane-associated phospholipid phosphatase